ncbi:MAG: S8 family peptidase [Candidatus Sericytochromatia bacterium]
MFFRNNKSNKFVFTALSLAFLLTSCKQNPSLLDSPSEDKYGASNTDAIQGEIVVRFSKTMNNTSISAFANANNLKAKKFVQRMNSAVFQIPSDSNTDELLTELKNDSSVDYAERNYKIGHNYTVNDQKAKEQNGLAVANFPKAWDITFGSKNIVIAVIDTGADLTHPDLKNKLVQGYNIIEPDKPPMDDNGHGTHASGIAAAETNNKIGVAGAAPNCKIMPVKALNGKGSGDTVNVAYGIVWAVDHGANVLNLSLGGPQNETVKRAVEYALAKNVTVVAAMGNSALEAEEKKKPSLLKAFPAALPGVISVGAVDFSRQRADFSNYGEWISVAAPGVSILSTMPTYETTMTEMEKNKGYDFLDGTSMACPMVAGLAGLILSRYPNYTPQEVKAKLESTATDIGKPGFDNEYGYGLINAYKAVL